MVRDVESANWKIDLCQSRQIFSARKYEPIYYKIKT